MGVHSMTIYASPGLDYVEHINLAYKRILHVERNGLGHELQDEGPSHNEYAYTNSLGRLTFNTPFEGPTVGRINRSLLETVFVLYKSG